MSNRYLKCCIIVALGPRRKRQARGITIMLQRATSRRYMGARGGEEGSCPGWELMHLASPLEKGLKRDSPEAAYLALLPNLLLLAVV